MAGSCCMAGTAILTMQTFEYFWSRKIERFVWQKACKREIVPRDHVSP